MYKPKVIKRKIIRRKTTRRKVVKKSGVPTRALTKLVQRVVSRNVENKSRQAYGSMNCIYPQIGGSYAWYGLLPLTPYSSVGAPTDYTITINQGTGAGSRVGDVIKTKKVWFKGVIVPNPYSADLNPNPKPMEVCIWIFKLKRQTLGNTITEANGAINNNFFQSGNTALGVNGGLFNIVQTMNTDYIRLFYKRVFKVGYSAGTISGDRPNNDFAMNRKFSIDVTKYIPKNVRYNDNTDTPSIDPVYVFIAPFRADGTVQTGNYAGVNLSWELNYVYEDA